MDFFHYEDDAAYTHGYITSAKYVLAVKILESHPLVAGKKDGEDSMGRSVIRELSVDEVLDKTFALADGFIERAAERGWIRQTTISRQEAACRNGELAGLREKSSYSDSTREALKRLRPTKVDEEA